MASDSVFKNNTLAGKVALVTGGSSGIGFEITRQLGARAFGSGAGKCLCFISGVWHKMDLHQEPRKGAGPRPPPPGRAPAARLPAECRRRSLPTGRPCEGRGGGRGRGPRLDELGCSTTWRDAGGGARPPLSSRSLPVAPRSYVSTSSGVPPPAPPPPPPSTSSVSCPHNAPPTPTYLLDAMPPQRPPRLTSSTPSPVTRHLQAFTAPRWRSLGAGRRRWTRRPRR